MASVQKHCTKHYKHNQYLNLTIYEEVFLPVIEGIDSCWSLGNCMYSNTINPFWSHLPCRSL